MNSIQIDFKKNILRIDGKEVMEPIMVTLPYQDEWENKKIFNFSKEDFERGVKYQELNVRYAEAPEDTSAVHINNKL